MKTTSIIPVLLISFLTASGPASNIATLTSTSTSTTSISITPTKSPSPSPSQTLTLHTPQITTPPETLTARFVKPADLTAWHGKDTYTYATVIYPSTVLRYPLVHGNLGVVNGIGRNAEGNGMVSEIEITEVRRMEVVVYDRGVDVGEVSLGGEGDVGMLGNAMDGARLPVYTNEGMKGSLIMGMSTDTNDLASIPPANSSTNSTKPTTKTNPTNPTSTNASNPSTPQCPPFTTNPLTLLSLTKDNTRRNPNTEPNEYQNEYQNSLLDNIIRRLNAIDAGNLRHAIHGEPDLDEGSDTDGEEGRVLSSVEDEGSGSGFEEGSESESDEDDDIGRSCEESHHLDLSLYEGGDWTLDLDSNPDSDLPSHGDNCSEPIEDLDSSTQANGKCDKSFKERDAKCTGTCAWKQNPASEPSSLEEKSGQEGNKSYISALRCGSHCCGNDKMYVSTVLDSDADADVDMNMNMNMEIHPSETDEQVVDESWGIQGEKKSSDDDDDDDDVRSEEKGRNSNVSLREESSNKRLYDGGGCGDTLDVCDCDCDCGFGGEFGGFGDGDSGVGIGVLGGERRKRRRIGDRGLDGDEGEMFFEGDWGDCMDEE
ncbi:hypothetical protein sscle_12g088100 [Sclerotinia sclerotiorum 1980 UF-70]|uniref:Uncharacterized protein n=1 Tax=Sclerotinia sclerotiorum (strain ATCC 18683 / 1980 / Ss-1) TaxID=665079 RepID=A0A1D9QGH3_SCLS1|nr:hypothetical protein sscle_12g088100 [Sclerotinia sclerotiorum 1980 UF-70]